MESSVLALVDRLPTHRPVMVDEVLAALAPAPGRVLLDGTLGGGGHAAAWLAASAPDGRVVGLDRDAAAVAAARARLRDEAARASLHHADFRDAGEVLDREGIASVDAVLLDLGLGSHQLDDPERGFSFRFDGPLDMRFDRERPGRTAAEILARSSEPELAELFAELGEVRGARKLARQICEERARAPFASTVQLADFVRRVLPARGRTRIDPATLVFQALRIAVNDELSGLGDAIEALARRLAPGGRIAVVSFHSLEDRVVKRTLRRLAERCRCRRGDPCTCGAAELLELPRRKPERPGPQELVDNPRARSARLRHGVRR